MFSDKSCIFPNTGSLAVDWGRWHRAAIEKSAKQLLGAQRWIEQFPERIFLDPKCTLKLPFELPPRNELRFHRIAVALGATERCRTELKGSGSLPFQAVQGNQSKLPDQNLLVKPLRFDGRPIHVLDDFTLPLLLRELDTAPDFIRYLTQKDEFLAKFPGYAVPGEEDLLSVYLSSATPTAEPAFPVTATDCFLSVREGSWSEYRSSPSYRNRHSQLKDSYPWDRLIETFGKHFSLDELIQFGSDRRTDQAADERRLRALANTSRAERLLLAHGMYGLALRTAPGQIQVRLCITPQRPKTGFLFLQFPVKEPNEKVYRDARTKWLVAKCVKHLSTQSQLDVIVGISCAQPHDPLWAQSREIVVISRSEISDSDRTRLTRFLSDNETVATAGKVGRNDPCPCGSAQKYKRCHGK